MLALYFNAQFLLQSINQSTQMLTCRERFIQIAFFCHGEETFVAARETDGSAIVPVVGQICPDHSVTESNLSINQLE